jgi:activator of 2-hydroxyglutaryl-CoA dehydratase
VYVPPEPQIVGAYGAALIAKRKYLQKFNVRGLLTAAGY